MTDVKMTAVDTLHISSVSSDHLLAGQEFEVAEDIAANLEARGLATRSIDLGQVLITEPVVTEPAVTDEKEAIAPENKMVAPLENKSANKPARKPRG
jgi:hypothetical protein